MSALRRVVVAGALAVFALGAAPELAYAQRATAYYEFLTARRLEADGNDTGALAALERAAAADQASAEIRAEIAAFHIRHNRSAEAEKAARAALALDEKNVEANRVLGEILAAVAEAGRGRNPTPQAAAALKDAILHLERAVTGAVVPDSRAQIALGLLYIQSGQTDKAVQTLTRAVSSNPGSIDARFLLAQAYAASKNLDGAISVLEDVVEDEPGIASALGQYQDMAGRLAEAAQSYTIALSVQPNNPEIKFRRILVLYRAKQYAQAAQFAGDARRQHPTDPRFAQVQARALFDGGDRDGGISLLEAAAKLTPVDSQTLFTLVDLYQESGRSSDAERVLRQIVSLEPANHNALNTLGYMLAVRGDRLDEAIGFVRRALEAEPDNGAYLDSLGWAHFRRGDLGEAEKYLTQAAQLLPENSEVLDHLGDVHAKRGRWQEAIGAWTRALSGDADGIDRAAIERKIGDARAKLPR